MNSGEEVRTVCGNGEEAAAAGSGGSVEEREPDRGEGARGVKRRLGLKCLAAALLVLVLFCLAQVFGSYTVKRIETNVAQKLADVVVGSLHEFWQLIQTVRLSTTVRLSPNENS